MNEHIVLVLGMTVVLALVLCLSLNLPTSSAPLKQPLPLYRVSQ